MPETTVASPHLPRNLRPPEESDSLREWRKSIRVDACLFALLLTACGALFYLHWEMWEDQSAQVYMTWGMFHGLKPYVDLVDPNWPGVLLPHTLAYLLSGVDAWGLRAVDLLFLLGLLSATSFVLAAWKTPRSLRMLAGCGFLLNYFGTGWWWTAQRESFAWPLFVTGAIPLLLELRPSPPARGEDNDPKGEPPAISSLAWFGFGTVVGFSLWIKPVAWLALALLLVITLLLCDAKQQKTVIQRSCWFIAGIAAMSLLFILAMAATGMLPGFIKWGIIYDLGPYSQVKWPWTIRLWITAQFLLAVQFMPLPLLLSVAGCMIAGVLRLPAGRWRRFRRPLLAALALVFAGLMTALLQGKNHSLYHFIPMDWSIAFFAATIWSVVPWKKAFADAAAGVALLAVATMLIHGPASAGPTAGEVAADRVRPKLSQQDEVVEWGYAPSLLARLQRRTPFQTFIATSFLVTSPPDSWASREVMDRLNKALLDRSVRYLFVDQIKCFIIQTGYPYPRDYLSHDPKVAATLSREYRALPAGTLSGFDVWEHTIPKQALTR